MDSTHIDLPPSPLSGVHAIELVAGSEPLLQAFFDANPEYFLIIQDEPAAPTEAHEEIHGKLPTGWSFTKKWVIGYVKVSVRRTRLEKSPCSDNDAVQLANSWTRWKQNRVASAGATALS